MERVDAMKPTNPTQTPSEPNEPLFTERWNNVQKVWLPDSPDAGPRNLRARHVPPGRREKAVNAMALQSLWPEQDKPVWTADEARIEEIYLTRRAHNRAGHKPRAMPRTTPEPAERVEPARRPRRATTVERTESLRDMARRIGAKGRRA